MTPLAHAQKLSFAYELAPQNLFSAISFRIHQQSRIGLIGDNGCGKSTLFQLLIRASQGAREGILCQTPLHVVLHEQDALKNHNDKSIEQFLWLGKSHLWQAKKRLDELSQGSEWQDSDAALLELYEAEQGYEHESLIARYHQEFKLDHLSLQGQIRDLSGGERQKFALLKLLLQKPDLLLLDEPTNHLDQEGLTWLMGFLNGLEIPFVVISHERQLLDQVVQEIWHLKDQGLTIYPGNYSEYKEHQEMEYQKQLHAYEVQKEKVEALETALEAKQARALELAKFKPERKRAKNGRILSRDTYKVKGCELDKSLMSKAKAMETRITQMIEKENAAMPQVERKKRIALPSSDIRSRHLLQLNEVGFIRDERRILSQVDLSFRPGEQIVLTGPNGSGKTTLLELIAGHLQPDDGEISRSPQLKVAYLTQVPHLNSNRKQVLSELFKEYPKTRLQTIRNLLGSFHFQTVALTRSTEKLSPGEIQKVCLALMLSSDCNLLILDEPTNHLEISSREALQESLVQFEGALILTSHDSYLREAVLAKNSARELSLPKLF
jgi:ATP-binding cassette subfamily F protein 3